MISKVAKSLFTTPLIHLEIMDTNGNVWRSENLAVPTGPFVKIPDSLKIGSVKAIEVVRRNKATLLAISYSSFSDPSIDAYFSALPEDLHLPKYVLRPIINPLKWALWSGFINNSGNTFSFFGDLPQAEETFGMQNKLAAYLFLIDSAGQIRWKSAGPPSATRLDDLKDKINILFYE